MIEKLYFIILNHSNGKAYPLMDNNKELAMFENETEAILAASNNDLAINFGYEVFELGGGL